MIHSPLLVLRNVPHEGPGLLLPVSKDRGFIIDDVNLSDGEIQLSPESYCGIVICGGPDSVNDDSEKITSEIEYVKDALAKGIPILGICLGMQILAKAVGGLISAAAMKEIGFKDPKNEQFQIQLTSTGTSDSLFYGCGNSIDVFQLHGETIEINDEITLLGTGKWVENQAIKVGKCAYGIQSHIELTEEMFEDWLTLDADLRRFDSEALRLDFKGLKTEYERTASLIFNNFLNIVENEMD